jgi:hypothetical protein
MATQHQDPKNVIAEFREWSLDDQLALVRSLIQELAAHERSASGRGSVYDLAGIAKKGSEIPSDEQIDAWLDERRERHMQDLQDMKDSE